MTSFFFLGEREREIESARFSFRIHLKSVLKNLSRPWEAVASDDAYLSTSMDFHSFSSDLGTTTIFSFHSFLFSTHFFFIFQRPFTAFHRIQGKAVDAHPNSCWIFFQQQQQQRIIKRRASLAFLSQTTHTRPQQLGSWSSKMFFFSSNSFVKKRKVNFDFFSCCSVLWTAFSVCADKRERKRKKICKVTEKSYFVWSTFSRHRRGQ